MSDYDARNAGSIGGAYSSSQQRKDAGVGQYDSDFIVQQKLASKSFDDFKNSISSSSSSGGSAKIPGPVIFGDPDVQKAIFKGLAFLIFAVCAFYLVFNGTIFASKKVDNLFTVSNSSNWEYRADGKFGLATLLTSKDGNSDIKQFGGNPDSFINKYQSIYGNLFSSEDYQNLHNVTCSKTPTACSDISFYLLRDLAISKHKVEAFDSKTILAINNYWKNNDLTHKYNYEIVYGSCAVGETACNKRLENNSIYISYRNTLEKPL